MKNPTEMTDEELQFAFNDLTEVVKIQEKSLSVSPKLGEYRRDLKLVHKEQTERAIRRRRIQHAAVHFVYDCCYDRFMTYLIENGYTELEGTVKTNDLEDILACIEEEISYLK